LTLVELPFWDDVVQKWHTWEKLFEFVQAGHDKVKLGGARIRPMEVEWWTKRKRIPTPEIRDVAHFGTQWWNWWREVNPVWRRKEGNLLGQDGDGSWEVLAISGINRLLSPLMCLRWWFGAGGEKDPLWREAVSDMSWVLDQLIESQYVPFVS
ncbi:hypothetical protein C8J56DRAFT_767136, partial [Mycena floridula]